MLRKNNLSSKRLPTLSIVIPAYREENRIGKTLEELAQYLKSHLLDYEIEVVVVTAESPDRTTEVVMEKAELFSRKKFNLFEPGPKVGKGRDVKHGMLNASGDYRIFMDADLATPLRYLEPMAAYLKSGDDIVIGIRYIKKIHAGIRSLISQAGNILSKIMVDVYHSDTQCGFKGFTKQAAELCFGRQVIMGWGFDIELLAIAKLHKLKVTELLVEDWVDVEGGTLDENIHKAAVRTLHELATIRNNLRRDYYLNVIEESEETV